MSANAFPELYTGQFRSRIRGNPLVNSVGLNEMQGKPFLAAKIVTAIHTSRSDSGGR